MQLRNKKTGEICDFKIIADYDDCSSGWRLEKHNGEVLFYDHIDEIHSEWEDYEEPKEYWYIDCDGEVYSADRLNGFDLERMLNIGNCFNSREEAEKAVEKLKAVKRLKDKGFRFRNWYWNKNGMHGFINFSIKSANIDEKDIDLLFGGEE